MRACASGLLVGIVESGSAMRGLLSVSLFALGVLIGAFAMSPERVPNPDEIISALRAHGAAGFAALTPAIGAERETKYAQPFTSTNASEDANSRQPDAELGKSVLQPSPTNETGSNAQRVRNKTSRRDHITDLVIRQAPVLVRPANSFSFVDATGRDALGAEKNAAYPYSPAERSNLIIKVQRELKRAGCYFGKIDGSWGAGSKRGITTFLTRVNSALPVEEPDYFQLALLRSHPGKVCGATCPANQTLSASGKCIARPIIANASHPRLAREVSGTKSAKLSSTASTEAGRLNQSTSQQVKAPKTRSETASLGSFWGATSEQLPLVVPTPKRVRAPQKANVRRTPPPGRMALSGPDPSLLTARQRAPGVSSLPDTSVQRSDNYSPSQKPATSLAAPKPKRIRPKVTQRKAGPRKTASIKRKKSKWSKKRRQMQIMRQAFGDSMF